MQLNGNCHTPMKVPLSPNRWNFSSSQSLHYRLLSNSNITLALHFHYNELYSSMFSLLLVSLMCWSRIDCIVVEGNCLLNSERRRTSECENYENNYQKKKSSLLFKVSIWVIFRLLFKQGVSITIASFLLVVCLKSVTLFLSFSFGIKRID